MNAESFDSEAVNQDALRLEFEELLRDAQQSGLAKKKISARMMASLAKSYIDEQPGDILSFLADHSRSLLTKDGRTEVDDLADLQDQSSQMGKYAPNIRITSLGPPEKGEPAATDKQIAFLKRLGVEDDDRLDLLGKRQASDLIDRIIVARDEMQNMGEPKHKSGGCVLVLLLVMAAVIYGVHKLSQ